MTKQEIIDLFDWFDRNTVVKFYFSYDYYADKYLKANPPVPANTDDLHNQIINVHEALEGRYTLDGSDLHEIHGMLCEMKKKLENNG